MIELNKKLLDPTTIILFSILFFIPLISYSEQIDDLWDIPRIQQMLTTENSSNSKSNFISGNVHYQIRDNSDALIGFFVRAKMYIAPSGSMNSNSISLQISFNFVNRSFIIFTLLETSSSSDFIAVYCIGSETFVKQSACNFAIFSMIS